MHGTACQRLRGGGLKRGGAEGGRHQRSHDPPSVSLLSPQVKSAGDTCRLFCLPGGHRPADRPWVLEPPFGRLSLCGKRSVIASHTLPGSLQIFRPCSLEHTTLCTLDSVYLPARCLPANPRTESSRAGRFVQLRKLSGKNRQNPAKRLIRAALILSLIKHDPAPGPRRGAES